MSLHSFLDYIEDRAYRQITVALLVAVIFNFAVENTFLRDSFIVDLDRSVRDEASRISGYENDLARLPNVLHLIVDATALDNEVTPFVTDRKYFANLLDLSRSAPGHYATFLDVDLRFPFLDQGDDALLEALHEWAADEKAPLLLVFSSRQFGVATPIEQETRRDVRFSEEVKAIIANATNIIEVQASSAVDSDGVVRRGYFRLCPDQSLSSLEDLPSTASVMAFGYHHGEGLRGAEIKAVWQKHCQTRQGEFKDDFYYPIVYNLSDRRQAESLAYSNAQGNEVALLNIDYSSLRDISSKDALPKALWDILSEKRFHIISSANLFSGDVALTPYGPMSGPVVVSNSARSLIGWPPLQGPVFLYSLIIEIFLVLVVSLVWFGARYIYLKPRKASLGQTIIRIVLNPLIRKFICASVATFGLVMLYAFYPTIAYLDGMVVCSYITALFFAHMDIRGMIDEARNEN